MADVGETFQADAGETCQADVGETCQADVGLRCRPGAGLTHSADANAELQATATGILPMRACHSFGPVVCTEVPSESTATVTGMSSISNS